MYTQHSSLNIHVRHVQSYTLCTYHIVLKVQIYFSLESMYVSWHSGISASVAGIVF